MLVRKTTSLADVQIKLAGDDAASGTFAGYASVFGGVDSYGDTVQRGAFSGTLRRNGTPKMLLNHDMQSLPIGRWIRAEEDDHGLFVEGELTPGSSMASEVRAALKHGVIDGLSIGFFMRPGDYQTLDTGGRLIQKVNNLVEVSVVTFPADAAARVDLDSVKSEYGDELQQIENLKDLERFLRDAGGFSKSAALAFVARAKAIIGRSDSGANDPTALAVQQMVQRLHQMSSRLPL